MFRTRPTAALLALAVLLGVGACSSSDRGRSSSPSVTSAPDPGCAARAARVTEEYRAIPGVDSNLTSLDVYAPAATCPGRAWPVIVWVHGGGFQGGDKRDDISEKARWATARGWMLVSVNYRLIKVGRPESAKFPDYFDDVAASVAWVRDEGSRFGGDPNRIALFGHSAGADIVGNVTTNPGYLAAHGLRLADIRCAGPLETVGFDKENVHTGAEWDTWKKIFADVPDYLRVTSAMTYVKPGVGIPATIAVIRGSAERERVQRDYLRALAAAGVPTEMIDARELDHAEVGIRIGDVDDEIMTPPLTAFLAGCFAH